MAFDFRPAGRERYLALYDPGAIPAEFPVDPDLETQEPAPPPDEAVEALARDGRALVVEMPVEWDCEAGMRVFVDEAPPAELLACASRENRVEGARLAVPSGTLVADGIEFLTPAGTVRSGATDERASVAPGRYRLDGYDTFAWKTAHRDRHLRANTSWRVRQGFRLLVVAAVLGLLLFAVNAIAVVVLAEVLTSRGWPAIVRPAFVLLVLDVIVFGAIWAYDASVRRRPDRDPLTKTRRLHDAFDAETPDLFVVLTRLADRPRPGACASPPALIRVSA